MLAHDCLFVKYQWGQNDIGHVIPVLGSKNQVGA